MLEDALRDMGARYSAAIGSEQAEQLAAADAEFADWLRDECVARAYEEGGPILTGCEAASAVMAGAGVVLVCGGAFAFGPSVEALCVFVGFSLYAVAAALAVKRGAP